MATRVRGNRRGRGGAPAATTRAARNTRQNAPPAASELEQPEDSGDEGREASTGLLAMDPPSRRGARVAQSDITIPSQRPENDSDVEEDEDDEEDADAPLPAEVEDEVRLAVMTAGLPDVQRLSDDLWTRFKNPNYESQQYKVILNMKRKAFLAVREEYEDSHIAPFVDTQRLRLLDERTGGQGAAFTVLRKMNLTSALDIIDQVLRGEDTDRRQFLTSLSRGIFPFLFNGNPEKKYSSEAVLDLYTYAMVEELQSNPDEDPIALIASIFCEPGDDSDFAHLFSHGPFRTLGGKNKDEEDKLVSDRIQELIPIVKKDKKGRGVTGLRKAYPLKPFFHALRTFMLESWPTTPDKEIFHDAEEEIDIEDTPSVQESQPIQRPPGSAPARQSLLEGQELLRGLVANASPSARRQTMPPPARPFASPDPGSEAAQAAAQAARAAAETLAHVAEAPAAGDDDDFETDRRVVNNGKRPAAPAAGRRQQKRQRISDAVIPPSAQQPPSSAIPGQSTMPPPYQTQMTMNSSAPPAGSPVPDFEAVKARKRQLADAARAARADGPSQQRKPWSAEDCTTLLLCIYERHASWSQIQESDSHRFETPRNQQAYRDKARNMKVDYLITDAVLPPCFDLVALGKKEQMRLKGMGKNPSRREGDLDEEGNPVNTSFMHLMPEALQEDVVQQQMVQEQAVHEQVAQEQAA